MILKESYSLEWIHSVQQEHKGDPILIEKVILALALLEQLKLSGQEFIFKGGTSLILLLGEAKRLSIDIDIIVNPKEEESLEKSLDLIIEQGVFKDYEKNERKVKTNISKAHYKFHYQSAISERNEYILLDVLFEENPYIQVLDVPICSKFTKHDEKTTYVKLPSINCILGDKLTAFAPATIGISYNSDKEIEIIKQLFDVATLFDLAEDINIVKETFMRIAKQEIKYRDRDLNPVDVLMDIFQTAAIITYRGKKDVEHFDELLTGIRNIKPYILTQSFNLETAISCASKAAYLSMLLLKDIEHVEKFTSIEDVGTLNIQNPEFSKFNKLKKTDPQAFYYWCKAIQLYEEEPGAIGKTFTITPGVSVPL